MFIYNIVARYIRGIYIVYSYTFISHLQCIEIFTSFCGPTIGGD